MAVVILRASARGFAVFSPYSTEYVSRVKLLYPGPRWVPTCKAWDFLANQHAAVMKIVEDCYPGVTLQDLRHAEFVNTDTGSVLMIGGKVATPDVAEALAEHPVICVAKMPAVDIIGAIPDATLNEILVLCISVLQEEDIVSLLREALSDERYTKLCSALGVKGKIRRIIG